MPRFDGFRSTNTIHLLHNIAVVRLMCNRSHTPDKPYAHGVIEHDKEHIGDNFD